MSRTRAILLGPEDRDDVRAALEELRPTIDRHTELVRIDLGFDGDLADVEADLAIVLGGDGSILRAAHQMGYRQRPVVGVNLGKLGFLADVQPDELPAALLAVAEGRYRVVEHLMFDCEVERGGAATCRMLGLNEAAVLAGAPFTILDVQLYVDGELATTYSCDGLIVSTPVGSTAHSLSAGGPILRKDLQAFVISPVSPHTLTNRPVVDSADRVYELVVPRPHEGTTLVVDGVPLCKLSADDRVRVRRSEARFQFVQVAGHGYYRTLREKLGWGGRINSG